jgi:hypothetical protein
VSQSQAQSSQAQSSQPSSEQPSAAAVEPESAEVADPDGAPEAEVPLNRAARRAKAKQTDPSHVGPRAGRTGKGRSARSHTKRQT